MSSEIEPTDAEVAVAQALLTADGADAGLENGQRFADLMRQHPEAMTWLTDLALSTVKRGIERMRGTPAAKAILRVSVERLREELGRAEASPAERLLIDQIAICYLRLHLAEREYEWVMSDDCTLAEASYLERKLSAVQRRYLRAVETLARVRKLLGGPSVQVNIAAAGGQQVVANR